MGEETLRNTDLDRALIRIKAPASGATLVSSVMDWQPITSAPFDRDLELAVIDADGVHALVFPCRRILRSWVKAGTTERVDVHPTHWREWKDS